MFKNVSSLSLTITSCHKLKTIKSEAHNKLNNIMSDLQNFAHVVFISLEVLMNFFESQVVWRKADFIMYKPEI